MTQRKIRKCKITSWLLQAMLVLCMFIFSGFITPLFAKQHIPLTELAASIHFDKRRSISIKSLHQTLPASLHNRSLRFQQTLLSHLRFFKIQIKVNVVLLTSFRKVQLTIARQCAPRISSEGSFITHKG